MEPHAAARPRIARLLHGLLDGAADGPAALVCHSLLIRAIFRSYAADGDSRALADGYVPNCGVARVTVARDGAGRLAVSGAGLAFGGAVVFAH